jgi:hypothetical protein
MTESNDNDGIIMPILSALWNALGSLLAALTPASLFGLGILLAGICIIF